MEAAHSSEISVNFYWKTQHHISKEKYSSQSLGKNLNSNMPYALSPA
jgi:hypothetical protein